MQGAQHDRISSPVAGAYTRNQHFWDGTRVGELRLQQCNDCQHTYFPPRPFCPECSSRNVQIVVASGRATLEVMSSVIVRIKRLRGLMQSRW